MLEDMEYNKKVSMDQVSKYVKDFKNRMSRAEEQLLDYSKALSRRSKMPADQMPNFPPLEAPDTG
eukprot:6863875-Karenia_brevis.AAC.1